MNNSKSKYPIQIDDGYTDQLEALINIENILGTLPNGPEFSTVSDRLNAVDKDLKSLLKLNDYEHLHNLNLSTILSLGNITGGQDIILGIGDCISSADNSIYLKGNVTINGGLDLCDHLDMDGNIIKNLPLPKEQNEASNKLYVDNQISAQNDKLNNIKNNNGNSIQYTKGISQPLDPQPNKYLKRNIDNSSITN